MEYLQTQFSPFFSSSWNHSCHPFQQQHIQMFLPFLCWGMGGNPYLIVVKFCLLYKGNIWCILPLVWSRRHRSEIIFTSPPPTQDSPSPNNSMTPPPVPPIPIHTWTDLNPEAVSRAPPDPIVSKYHPSQGAALLIHLLPSLGCYFLWIN